MVQFLVQSQRIYTMLGQYDKCIEPLERGSAMLEDLGQRQPLTARDREEMALAHAVGNAVEAAYRRGDLFEKRCRLMEDWAKYCGTPVARAPSGDGVALRGVS